jgi:hypothetical protein
MLSQDGDFFARVPVYLPGLVPAVHVIVGVHA